MVITLAPMAEWRLYRMAHLQIAKSGFLEGMAQKLGHGDEQAPQNARLTHPGSVAARESNGFAGSSGATCRAALRNMLTILR